jgi:hypothetical protein
VRVAGAGPCQGVALTVRTVNVWRPPVGLLAQRVVFFLLYLSLTCAHLYGVARVARTGSVHMVRGGSGKGVGPWTTLSQWGGLGRWGWQFYKLFTLSLGCAAVAQLFYLIDTARYGSNGVGLPGLVVVASRTPPVAEEKRGRRTYTRTQTCMHTQTHLPCNHSAQGAAASPVSASLLFSCSV